MNDHLDALQSGVLKFLQAKTTLRSPYLSLDLSLLFVSERFLQVLLLYPTSLLVSLDGGFTSGLILF